MHFKTSHDCLTSCTKLKKSEEMFSRNFRKTRVFGQFELLTLNERKKDFSANDHEGQKIFLPCTGAQNS